MRPARALALGAALALLLFAGFLALAYREATATPIVTRVGYTLPGLPPGTSLRVVAFSDTHQGRPDMPRGRLDALVAQVNGLEPDLVLLLGDYSGSKLVDFETSPAIEPALRPFARLQAPLGVFAVLGNHDNARWTPLVLARQPGPRLLVNAHADIGPLVVAGSESIARRADLAGTLARIPPGKPLLLMVHEGDGLHRHPRPAGLSALALAGHTHGGQMRLGGLSGAGLIGGTECLRGACVVAGWRLHVTSGVGSSWLPLRWGVPPEILLVTLRG